MICMNSRRWIVVVFLPFLLLSNKADFLRDQNKATFIVVMAKTPRLDSPKLICADD